MSNEQLSTKQLKLEAKLLKKAKGIQYSAALELVSKDKGFTSWHHANKHLSSVSLPEPIIFKGVPPFCFIMDRHDSGDFSEKKPGYAEDDDLFELILQLGIDSGLTERQAAEKLEEIVCLRYQGPVPKTALEASEIICNDFFFPPICLFINGKEYCDAANPNNPDKLIWKGYSSIRLFEVDEYEFEAVN